MKKLLIISIVSLFIAANSFAGFYSSSYDRDFSSIVAAIELEDIGIMNLIVSVTFLTKPQDGKLYESEAYSRLIERLQVEWKGVALQKILASRRLKRTELVVLKNGIQSEIRTLAEQLKKKLIPDKNPEVVFVLSDFFLLEPRDR